PLLLPVAMQFGVDPAHFGVIMVVNLALGMVTPPFGVNLFAACTVAQLPLERMIRSLVPFVLVTFGCLIIITYVPQLSLFFKHLVYGRWFRGALRGPAHGGEGSGEYRCPLGPERGAQGHRVGLGGYQNGGSSSRSAAAVAWVAAAFLAAALVAFLAAAFLAVFFTAFLAALAALAAVVLAVLLAVVLPGFSARGSNSNPILPSFCATKYALNLRLVREETKLVSRSVLPSASNLRICSGLTSCWRMTLPLRKVQLFSAPTDFSQT